jgi:TetR/AcrR family transcriptional regulator, transcriptional repressor for nem operon
MAQQRFPRDPDATRQRILHAAFVEFYQNGYQGGSLNRIVREAGGTKGALFHHFAGKEPLGYAVVDEIIGPLLVQRWLAPLDGAEDPISAIQGAFRRFIAEDTASGHFVLGCPLNNLAQEMSPLDEGFRTRVERLYHAWRTRVATALAAGAERGTVRADVDPHNAAALVVAAQMGIWGTGKQSQDPALMRQAGEAVCHWLESLRA